MGGHITWFPKLEVLRQWGDMLILPGFLNLRYSGSGGTCLMKQPNITWFPKLEVLRQWGDMLDAQYYLVS